MYVLPILCARPHVFLLAEGASVRSTRMCGRVERFHVIVRQSVTAFAKGLTFPEGNAVWSQFYQGLSVHSVQARCVANLTKLKAAFVVAALLEGLLIGFTFLVTDGLMKIFHFLMRLLLNMTER